MNKSKMFTFFDQLFYFLLMALPFVLLALVAINGGVTGVQDMYADYTGLFAGTDLYNSINEVIGVNGVAPLLNARTAVFVDLVVYVVYVTALHLLIDCLKFIPACAHRLLDKLGGEWFE